MKKTLIAMMVIASTSALAQNQKTTTEATDVAVEKTIINTVVETTTEATDVVVEKTEETVDAIVKTTTEVTDTVAETSETLWDKFKNIFK